MSMAATPWLDQNFARRGLVVLASLVAVVLLGGADRIAAGTSGPYCSVPDPTGREFCVTVNDIDNVSPSGVFGEGKTQVNVTAYQRYTFSIVNEGGSTLTNGILTVALTDRIVTGDPPTESFANSKAVFIASGSASFCSLTNANPNTATCRLPNIPAGPTPLVFTVGYRTSDALGVVDTRALVNVGFKEGAKKGANPATLDPFTEITSLEPDPQQSVAWSPPGQNVSLGTSPLDTQFSVLDYKVPGNSAPFQTTLRESDGYVCDETVECFGELVTTDLPDPTAFSASNVFHLRIVISLDLAPGGSVDDYVISHKLDDGSFEVLDVDDHCTATPPATPAPLPCFTVAKDNRLKLLIFDIYGFENGGWMPG